MSIVQTTLRVSVMYVNYMLVALVKWAGGRHVHYKLLCVIQNYFYSHVLILANASELEATS